MLTVKLVTALTIAVMSMSLELVESARIGTVLHHTVMHLIGLENITSVETQMENPMLGVTQ